MRYLYKVGGGRNRRQQFDSEMELGIGNSREADAGNRRRAEARIWSRPVGGLVGIVGKVGGIIGAAGDDGLRSSNGF